MFLKYLIAIIVAAAFAAGLVILLVSRL